MFSFTVNSVQLGRTFLHGNFLFPALLGYTMSGQGLSLTAPTLSIVLTCYTNSRLPVTLSMPYSSKGKGKKSVDQIIISKL